MDDVAALESNIDKNPVDPINHYLLADKHRENGNENEADFRQSMGDWMRRWAEIGKTPHNPSIDSRFPWFAHVEFPPKGVDGGQLWVWFPTREQWAESPASGLRPEDPTHAVYNNRVLKWQTYRGMENAFRNQFMKSRNRDQAEKLARRVISFRKMKNKVGRK